MNTRTYSCPKCVDDITVEGEQLRTKCERCNTWFHVNDDYEHVDGMWRDRTTLDEITL